MNDRALAKFLSDLDDDLAREDRSSPFHASPIGSGERMYRAMERLAHAGVGDERAAELLRADVERRSFLVSRRDRVGYAVEDTPLAVQC